MSQSLTLKIARIEKEAAAVRTYWFKHRLDAKPGQFVMLWIPGFDQKPISIAYADKKEFALTVSAIGPATKHLEKMKVGDVLGILGPLGTYYKIPAKKKLVCVAGGYGAAPLYFATLEALQKGCQVDFILGARTKDLLLYQNKLAKTKARVHITTNDGSKGKKGLVTDVLEQLCASKKPFEIMTCGPELMEYGVFQIAEEYKVPCQISIERYMKCGTGVCGSCSVDPQGLRMCTEGPVVDKVLAKMIYEFGKYHRDATGTKIYYKK
ncbi:MAG: dihydroorotate dehydrogenase electron transfer subunit [Candidatus Gracilibacteria bacterium]|nr:dihydroorotate dehydrogenase electron transfer subunit [Candidatus Gracilibacteria bacterium]